MYLPFLFFKFPFRQIFYTRAKTNNLDTTNPANKSIKIKLLCASPVSCSLSDMVIVLCLVRVKILWVKLMNLCRTEQSESTRCSRQNKSTRFVLLLSGERCTGGDQTVTHTTGWWLDTGFSPPALQIICFIPSATRLWHGILSRLIMSRKICWFLKQWKKKGRGCGGWCPVIAPCPT